MTGRDWILAFAEKLGVDAPDPAVVSALLELAATAAHGSERTAAPIACYLVGLARIDIETAARLARSVAGKE